MAIASAKLNGYDSTAKYQSVYLEFWQISQSIENNQTTFGYKAYMQSNVSGASGYTGYGHYEFFGANPIAKVSNQTWSWNYVTAQSITQGTFTKTHNADGTLASQTLTITAGGSTALGYATVSISLPVATIPRATQPTVNYSSRDMGLEISIGVSGVATFSHKLYYTFTGIAKTLITTVTAGVTSYAWTIPLATLAPKIPNSTSGTVTITAETLSGSTVIGSKTVTFTATVPTSAVPTISSKTATEAVSGLASQFGALIQGKSKLALAMAATAPYGATISSYSITANGQTFSTSSGTTGFLSTAGSNTITYRVTDSRGRSASATLNVTVLTYAPPQIHTFRVERVNASGVVDPTGDRVKATYKITVASLGSKNTKAYTLKYKRTDVTTWTSVVLSSASFVPDTSTTVTSISTSNSYDFSLVATDYFESTTVFGKVSSGYVPMHFRAGGKGVGIGKANEGKAILEVFGDCILQNTGADTKLSLEQIQGNAGIEIGNQTLVGAAYIDFHSGGQGSDFDARILADGGTSLDGQGRLNFTCQEMNFSATPKIGSHYFWHNGNIVQGQNGNGKYIKFPDGTMIAFGRVAYDGLAISAQWGSSPWYISSGLSLTFPATFYVNPTVAVHMENSSGDIATWANAGVSLTGFNGYFIRGLPATVNAILGWVAIGRWRD